METRREAHRATNTSVLVYGELPDVRPLMVRYRPGLDQRCSWRSSLSGAAGAGVLLLSLAPFLMPEIEKSGFHEKNLVMFS